MRLLLGALLAACAACAAHPRATSIAPRVAATPREPAAAEVAPEPPEPPSARPPTPLRRVLASGPARPELIAARRVDVASLPLRRWGPPDGGSRVRVTASGPERYGFVVDGVSFAEFTIVDDFGAFTGADFFHGRFPACGFDRRERAAWRGFSQRNWTDAGIDVAMSRGAFDLVSCTSVSDTTIHGRAAALVPGFIYALRVEDGGESSLWVLLPHASLASASDDAAASGSFSMVTLPLEPHHVAAAALRISPAALAAWRRMRSTRTITIPTESVSDALLVSIEIDASSTDDVAVSIAFALPRGGHAGDFAAILDAVR